VHSHLNEFLEFIRPEIEEITGDYYRWLEGIFDVDGRRYYDAEPERYGVITDNIQTSEDWCKDDDVEIAEYDENGDMITHSDEDVGRYMVVNYDEPPEYIDESYLIDERYNEVIS